MRCASEPLKPSAFKGFFLQGLGKAILEEAFIAAHGFLVSEPWRKDLSLLIGTYDKRRWPVQLFHRTADSMALEEARSRLLESPPEKVLPLLIPEFVRSSKGLGQILGPILLSLAEKVPPESWLSLDQEIRSKFWNVPRIANRDHSKESDNPASILVGLCDPSGHRREQAIHQAHQLPGLLGPILLLVRLNDWAQPIRKKVASRILDILATLPPDNMMRLVPLIARLKECLRRDPLEWLDDWPKFVASRFNEAVWLEMWAKSSQRNKVFYFKLIQAFDSPPPKAVSDALLRSNHRTVLFWFIRNLLPRLDQTTSEDARRVLSSSHAVPVRRAWLEFVIEESPEKAIPELFLLLLHRSKSLRQFSRFYLSRLKPTNFADHYLKALENPSTEAIALKGLSEVSEIQARPEILARLDSPVPTVRCAAINCISTEQLESLLPRVLYHCNSAVPSLSKTCYKRLMEIPREVGGYLLAHPKFFEALPEEAQIRMIRLAPNFAKWDGLEFLLTWDSFPSLHDEISRQIEVWKSREGRAYISLQSSRREKLSGMLEKSSLRERWKELIRFVIQNAE